MHSYDSIDFYFQKRLTMSTLALITQAIEDDASLANAVSATATAQAAQNAAQTSAVASAQALYADLAANGPAVTVDVTQTPPVVTEYSAVDPASFTTTVIRVAT